MKNVTIAVLFALGFLTNAVFAQQVMTPNQYGQYVASPQARQEFRDYWTKYGQDANDRDWEIAWNGKGKKPYNERIKDTQKVFGDAEKLLTTKEEKDYLAACEKMREAAQFLYHVTPVTGNNLNPEFLGADYTGPFFDKYGIRDDEIMVQMLLDRANENVWKVEGDLEKVRSRTSLKAQMNAKIAVFKARGKDYIAAYYQKYFNDTGHEPTPTAFIYLGSPYGDEHPGGETSDHDLKDWKLMFKSLGDPNGKDLVAQIIAGSNPSYKMPNLIMDNGIYHEPISKAALLFIARQADQCWQFLLNPPPHDTLPMFSGSFTYWKRDVEPGEPPLVLKVRSPLYYFIGGHSSLTSLNNHMPTSFLKGLCPEWKKALADFEKSLPTDGVSREYISSCHDSGYLWVPLNSSEAEKKWFNAMKKKESDLYDKYFDKERLKWHRLPAEDEYTKLLADQEAWLKAHPATDKWNYEQKLCLNFQSLAPRFSGNSSADTGTIGAGKTYRSQFTLEALELVEPKPVPVLILHEVVPADAHCKVESVGTLPGFITSIEGRNIVLDGHIIVSIKDNIPVVNREFKPANFEDIKVGDFLNISVWAITEDKLEIRRVRIGQSAKK